MFFRREEMSVSDETKRMITKAENVSWKNIDDTLSLVEAAFTLPSAVPFMIAAAVIMAPVSRFQALFETRDTPMPEAWYPLVEAQASDDGRFFVGRILSKKAQATTGDAMRFLAIEAAKQVRRTDPVSEPVSSELARTILAGYYEENRSVFDRVATSAGSFAGSAVGAAGRAASGVLHKLRVGF